ncbi:uncharacterized protein LOC116841417 [Odontomachus brunneus]|uniref:uncharacterized protein LOC116841417 n=1 Tax=Odontomachus brunneus TaxID=486640 RepID=UPI0013F23B23|nr:uncharacterized protein LOC116841417 [Odontomachus brunneus]
MKITWNYYYGIIYKLSSLTGIWPYLEPRARLLRVTLLSATLLTIFVPQMAQQFTCEKDLQCMFESMTSLLMTCTILVKVYTFHLNIPKIKIFTEHLFNDWKELETAEEYEVMKSHADYCRRFSLIYSVYCFMAVWVFMSVSIVPSILDIIWPLNESRPVLMPYPGYYFTDNREYFIYIFGHSLVAWEIIMAGVVAHDCLFVTYIEHICSKFAVVGLRFKYLFCDLGKTVENINTDPGDTYRKKVALFVHTHHQALKFAQILERTFTVPFALQLIFVVLIMSSTLLQITKESDLLEITRYVLYVIGQLIHLFCLSFEGQKLIDHSLQMRDRIYNSSWYEAPNKSQKLLILVMIQSLRPTCLSAGKIYIFSLQSFTTILQTSISYFTVLSSFQVDHLLEPQSTRERCSISAARMKITWNYYYGIIYKLSSLTGLWPYLEPRARLLRAALLSATLLTIFVPQIAQQFTCEKDLQCMFESMTSCLLTSVALVKVYTFQLNIPKIRIFTEHLFNDWKELETAEEYEVMKSYADYCRRFSLIYSVYCFMAVCVFMSVSIVPPILDITRPLNESRPVLMPYPGYYFVDNREYFIYIFGHSLVAWEIIIAGIVAHDCLFVTYIEHICSKFAVVGLRFKYLFCDLGKTVKNINTDPSDTYHHKIALFVHFHREALKFAQILERTFTVPFALELICVVLGMSSTLLQVTQESDLLEVTRYVLYVIGQLIHLFFLSFEGQKLIDHSLQTRDRIYNSSWYEAPTKSQKLLILVMIQSLRPTCLSAGKIYIFSLQSFTTILQTSMSYFTVLSSFQ